MPQSKLIIYALSESPAWDIDLEPGQAYIGCEKDEDGTLALIVSLADRDHLTPEQEQFLDQCEDVLRYEVFDRRDRTSVSQTAGKIQSPLRGTGQIPHPGDGLFKAWGVL